MNLRLSQLLNSLSLILVCVVILVVNSIRFIGLEKAPPGFQVDELGSAVTVQCLVTEGIDARGKRYPLFSELNYGSPKPPTYIYPAMLWTRIFGFSIPSYRAISAFALCLAIIGLLFLGRLLGSWEHGLWAMLVATISPWMWTFSRIAYETIFCLPYLVWGVYFFLRSKNYFNAVLGGFFLACAMYAYPPTRMHVPLMLPVLIWFFYKKNGFHWKFLITFVSIFTVTLIPLALKLLKGDFQSRVNQVTIFSTQYLASVGKKFCIPDLVSLVFTNYWTHFDPKFLFLRGDDNWAHSTHFVGILSWVDDLALLVGIILLAVFLWKFFARKTSGSLHQNWIVFMALNIAVGIIPAACTWEALPHALRTIGAWPFVMLLTGYCLWKVSCLWGWFRWIIVILAVCFSYFYLHNYFTLYPKAAYGMFSAWTNDEIKNCKTDEDWLKFMVRYHHQDFHVRYYLMNHRGDMCTSSRQKLDAMINYLHSRGMP